MKILVDGDVVSYRAAWSTKDGSVEQAILKTDEVMSHIIEDVNPYATKDDIKVFLTGKGNFRFDIAKTAVYKGNRKEAAKPPHLQTVRQHLIDAWDAVVSEGQEADDLIAIEATKLGDGNFVIVSTDKDFAQIPGTLYSPMHRAFKTNNSWEALVAFYTQILTGDTSDNIIGLKGIGPVKAAKLLEGCQTEFDLWQACLAAYDGNEDRVIENARLLWLRRHEGQVWQKPTA